MLTRREEDILILEIEEKNTELLMEWVEGKEGERDGSREGIGQQAAEQEEGEKAEGAIGPAQAEGPAQALEL